MVGQLIQNLVWIFPNGSTANTKPCLDTSKWWINGPSKTIWMDLNGSTACYQHCSNGIIMCVQDQLAFLKVKILNGFQWSISRRVNPRKIAIQYLNLFWLSNCPKHGQCILNRIAVTATHPPMSVSANLALNLVIARMINPFIIQSITQRNFNVPLEPVIGDTETQRGLQHIWVTTTMYTRVRPAEKKQCQI